MSKKEKFVLYLCFFALLLFSQSKAQTPGSISIGSGTLNYEVTTTSGTLTCGFLDRPNYVTYTKISYGDFSFVNGGVTTSLSGGTSSTSAKGITTDCTSEPPPSYPTATLYLPSGQSSDINVDEGPLGGLTYSVGTTVDPFFKVFSILYAAPGNESSTSFTNAKTNGTVTTVGSNFTSGYAQTYTVGILGVTAGISYGFSSTTGQSNAFTETIADASSLANDAYSAGPNTVNHAQDLFVIWLNPEVTAANTDYTVGTQYQNGSSELVDTVEIFGSEMQANSNGQTSVTVQHLNKQYDTATKAYDLPGLANVCASLHGSTAIPSFVTEYNNFACTQADQCGCTANDFAPIVATDPLLNANPANNATTATSPINFDSSGSLCNSPNSTDNCRFVPVPCSAIDCTLAGPSEPGGNHTANGFTQTDTSSTTLTFSTENTETTGYSISAGLGILGIGVQNSVTWTWTDTYSLGTINTIANQIGFSLASDTVGCSQPISVYEDTVFHTYALQQVPGDGSCP